MSVCVVFFYYDLCFFNKLQFTSTTSRYEVEKLQIYKYTYVCYNQTYICFLNNISFDENEMWSLNFSWFLNNFELNINLNICTV